MNHLCLTLRHQGDIGEARFKGTKVPIGRTILATLIQRENTACRWKIVNRAISQRVVVILGIEEADIERGGDLLAWGHFFASENFAGLSVEKAKLQLFCGVKLDAIIILPTPRFTFVPPPPVSAFHQ